MNNAFSDLIFQTIHPKAKAPPRLLQTHPELHHEALMNINHPNPNTPRNRGPSP